MATYGTGSRGTTSITSSQFASGPARRNGTASVVDPGGLTEQNYGTAVLLSGTGSLTASGTPGPSGTAALGGTGTLAAVATLVTQSGSAALSGAGTLGATGVPGPTGTAALGGTGTLSGAGIPTPTGTAAFSGAGSLVGSGIATIPHDEFEGVAVFSATGTLAAVGERQVITFMAPTVTERLEVVGQRTLVRVPTPVGISLLRVGDTWHQVRQPANWEIDQADVVYLGGRVYEITLDEADALAEAGYGDFVTGPPGFPSFADHGAYGFGNYGQEVYG